MSPISVVLYVLLWIIINTPIAHINRFVTDLPITADHKTSLTPTQIIKKYGYPAESHIVQTEDGYLLELHRIPYGKSGKIGKKRIPVLLVHGLFFSSLVWLVNTPDRSIACRLADEGYDVWMVNVRGTTYSQAHIEYTTNQKEFWDFSFPQMAKYDLPACIDYVLHVTEQKKLIYIGHSLGAYLSFALTSTQPIYNDKIIVIVAMAPATTTPHTLSPLLRLSPALAKPLQASTNMYMTSPKEILWEPYSSGSFFQRDVLSGIFIKYVCSIRISGTSLCEILWFSIWGGKPMHLSESVFVTILGGTSVKLLVQVSKLIEPGIEPPYHFDKITSLIKVYFGKADLTLTPKDLKALRRSLQNPNSSFIEGFGHLSYFTDRNVNNLFTNGLIEFLHNTTTAR